MKMQPKQLNAPMIPVADEDGLIRTKYLTHHIEVQLDNWAYSEPGDTYQLTLNGVPIGPVQTLQLPSVEAGESLKLSIDAESMLKKDGSYTVGYRIHNTLGGLFADSATTYIHVDRVAPGAGLLAPIIFPGNRGGSELTGMVPGYAGICAGDVIRTQCNCLPGPVHTVTPDEVTQIVEIEFPWEFFEGANSEIVKVDYVITDRAGNQSLNSQPAWVTLRD
jgi:hypothetical protein